MRFVFARHGESEANLLRVISNRGEVHGLTEKGRLQATSLGQSLSQSGIVAVFSSPLLRAIQTAEILSTALRLDYTVTDALREYDCGVNEGKSDAQSWELHQRTREDWLLRGQWESRIEGGESFLDIRRRFEPFIQGLLAEFQKDASLLLIGHGGLYSCMLPLMLTNVSFEDALHWPFPNTGTVLAESRPQGLVCLEWCGKIVIRDG